MRAPDEFWRLFIAIELPAGLRRSVKAHIDRLRDEVPDVRASWIRDENLHLTVKFLGDTALTAVESLAEAMQRAAKRVSAFEMTIGDCGVFPLHGKPRVLWLGLHDPSEQLNFYHQALEDECAKAGFAREVRPFHPHLTIARLRQPQDSRPLAESHGRIGFAPVSFDVRDVCLIRSDLGREGSNYTVISRHALP